MKLENDYLTLITPPYTSPNINILIFLILKIILTFFIFFYIFH